MPRQLLYTALHQAVLDCRPDQVRLLVEHCGADVNCRELFGRTPLMLCCALDCSGGSGGGATTERRAVPAAAMSMARVLLKAKPDLEIKDNLGRTALAYACIYGQEALVVHMARTQVLDPTEPDNDGCTPLHHAAVQGNPRITCVLVDLALESRASVDCRNRLGLTPLMLACQSGNCRTALFLLVNGCASAYLRDNACFLSALEWLERCGGSGGGSGGDRDTVRVRRAYTAGAARPRLHPPEIPPPPLPQHQQQFSYRKLHSASASLPRLTRPASQAAGPVVTSSVVDTGRRPSMDDPLWAERKSRSRPATVSAFRVQFVSDGDGTDVADGGSNSGAGVVDIDVVAMSEPAARRLLVRRLRAQTAQYSYLGPPRDAAARPSTSRPASGDLRAVVQASCPTISSRSATLGQRRTTQGGSSEVDNACRLLQLLQDSRAALPAAVPQVAASASAAVAARRQSQTPAALRLTAAAFGSPQGGQSQSQSPRLQQQRRSVTFKDGMKLK